MPHEVEECDMAPITYSAVINAPIERAFACVEDHDKIKQWAQGVEEIIPLEPWDPANPVGSRFRQRIREGGRLSEFHGEVVAYDKPRHLAITLGNNAFTMRVDYRFTTLNPTQTRLDYSADMVSGSWFGRLMGALFRSLTVRILHKQMAALKALAEREANLTAASVP